jgi:hypothetical protein
MQYSANDELVNRNMEELIESLDTNEVSEIYIKQLLVTIAKLANDQVGELELKILTNAIKEVRYAFKVFRNYDDRKKISVFGSARADNDDPNFEAAEAFSRMASDRDYMVISGAGPGIMEAANKGAGTEDSFGLHISIPHEYKPNRFIHNDEKCINFRYFFSRKLLFSKESSASIFFPGGFGTHDELFELLCLMQTGRHHLTPLVLCDQNGYWEQFLDYVKNTLLEEETIGETDLQLLDYVQDPGEALDVIDNFYSNFHSSRFLDEEYLVRFRELPSETALNELEDEFLHLCPESGFRVNEGPLDGEEPGAPDNLYRLVFYFTNQDYGELRRLVRHVNSWT